MAVAKCVGKRHEAAMGGQEEKGEKKMKLLTIFELAAKPERELRALYRAAFNAVARSDRTGEEQRNASASLANIRRVMNARGMRP